MARYLFTVTYRGEYFSDFRGREGVALGPPIPNEIALAPDDPIELRRPDGTRFRTAIRDLVMNYPVERMILLGPLIFLHEVPRGTEVWMLDGDPPSP